MDYEGQLVVYLSKGPDQERTEILERRELSIGGQTYNLSPMYLNITPLGLVKRLVSLRTSIPDNIQLEIRNDTTFDGLCRKRFRFVNGSYKKLIEAYKR